MHRHIDLVGRETELRRLTDIFALDGPRAVFVTGVAGVGKSHLVAEVGRRRPDDWRVERLVGAAGVATIPFGAVSHLIPPDPQANPAALMASARRSIAERAAGRRLVLMVDDGHLLDEASAAVVHQLVVHDEARLVTTVRPVDESPAALTAIRDDATSRHFELSPLDRVAADDLAGRRLGGTLHADLSDHLWSATQGSPLMIVLAIETAAERGVVQLVDGVWELTGPLDDEPLRELVARRIAQLSADERAAVRALALVAPIGRRAALDVAGHAVTDLVRRGIVIDEAGPILSIAHPLYSEVAGEQTPVDGRRRIGESFAAWLVEHGEDDDIDLTVRVAALVTTTGGSVGADLAIPAVGELLRRGDATLAEQIAARSLAHAETPTLRLLLARALASLGRGDAALDQLDSVRAAAEPSHELQIQAAAATGHVLAFVLGRPDEAAQALSEAADHLDPVDRRHLDSDRALFSAMAGDFRDVIEVTTRIIEDRDSDGAARTSAAVNLTLAHSMLAQIDQLDALTPLATSLADEHASTLPMAAVQIATTVFDGGTTAGRFSPVDDRAAERWASNPSWTAVVAVRLDAVGDRERALTRAEAALVAVTEFDPFRQRAQMTGIAELIRAQAGPLSSVHLEAVHDASTLAGAETRATVWVERARAWATVWDRPAEAVEIALSNGVAAIAAEHIAWAVPALHDIVRWHPPGDHIEPVVSAMTAAVDRTSGAGLLDAMLAHAQAAGDDDPAALTHAGDAFLALGSSKLAAEAFAQAARRGHQLEPDDSTWRRAALRSIIAESRCSGLRTPAIRSRPEPLSASEVAVALAAVDGASSRAIAERRYLSVRTIDNHLRSIYRKLDVAGRSELALVAGNGPVDPETAR